MITIILWGLAIASCVLTWMCARQLVVDYKAYLSNSAKDIYMRGAAAGGVTSVVAAVTIMNLVNLITKMVK